MRLTLDMRIAEDWAARHLGPKVGAPMVQGPGLPAVTRKVTVDADDPITETIKEKILASEKRNESLFCFVNQDYHYDPHELAGARLLRLRPTTLLRSYGERHGTIYDDGRACPKCGAGRVQVSVLRFDRKMLVRKSQDFLVSITADEWIVSRKLADLLRENAGPTLRLGPVHDENDQPIEEWRQLRIDAVVHVAAPPTRFGLDYFHEDAQGEYVCVEHGLSGLNLVSELTLKKVGKPNAENPLSVTWERVGRKAGWIVPAPLLVATRDLADVLLAANIRGIQFEVAYLT